MQRQASRRAQTIRTYGGTAVEQRSFGLRSEEVEKREGNCLEQPTTTIPPKSHRGNSTLWL